jgi:hypothetical protein
MAEVELLKEELGEWKEHSYEGNPIITYSFTELIYLRQWFVQIFWPEKTLFTWKGKFCFKLTYFYKQDDNTYQKFATQLSSSFLIYSKPSVWKKQGKFINKKFS